MIDCFICTTDHETETLTFCIIEMIIKLELENPNLATIIIFFS